MCLFVVIFSLFVVVLCILVIITSASKFLFGYLWSFYLSLLLFCVF